MVCAHFLYTQVLHIWIEFTLSSYKHWTFARGSHIQRWIEFVDRRRTTQMHLLLQYQLWVWAVLL